MGFERTTTVRFHEVDRAGIVYFSRVFEWCHVVYEELLRELFGGVEPIFATKDWGSPLVHASADYRRPFKLDDRVCRHRDTIDAIKAGKPAAVAVTTQVCEMSLDIDADLLITEECPITSLIQRMGRCRRGRDELTAKGPGEVLIYKPTEERVYLKDDLAGLDAFVGFLTELGTASQSDLAAAMQRLQEERTANAAASGSPAAAQAGQPGADQQSASPAGAAGGSQAGTGEGSGQGSGGGEGDGQLAEAGPRPAAPEGPAEKNADQLGDPAPRLDVAGQQVDVPARPGSGDERGLKTDRPGEQEQRAESLQAFAGAVHPAMALRRGCKRAVSNLQLGKGYTPQCLAHRHRRIETVTHRAP